MNRYKNIMYIISLHVAVKNITKATLSSLYSRLSRMYQIYSILFLRFNYIIFMGGMIFDNRGMSSFDITLGNCDNIQSVKDHI